MKSILCISIVMLVFSSQGASQVKIADAELNAGIPFVQLVDQNWNYLGSSDLNGDLDLSDLKKSTSTDTVTLMHISYEPLSVPLSAIHSSEVIHLKAKSHQLDQVTVKPRNDKKGYLRIDALFRSYQFYDNELKYYMDGMVDYVGKYRKQKFKNKLRQNRSYVNKQLEAEEKGQQMLWGKAGVPRLYKEFLPGEFLGKEVGYVQKADSNYQLFDNKDQSIVGRVIRGNGILTFELIDCFSKRERSFLGNESHIIDRQITLIFKDKGQNPEHISSFEDLLYYKTFTKFHFKRKGSDSIEEIIEMYEVFVNGTQYIEDKKDIADLDDFSKYYSMKEESHFHSEYWLDYDNEFYYPLRHSLEQKNLRSSE